MNYLQHFFFSASNNKNNSNNQYTHLISVKTLCLIVMLALPIKTTSNKLTCYVIYKDYYHGHLFAHMDI